MKSFLKKYRILFLSFLLVLLLFACQNISGFPIGKGSRPAFSEFCNTLFQDEITSNTLNLHFTLKNPASAGISSYDVSLGSMSGNTPKNSKRELTSLQKQLKKYSRRSLNSDEKLTYDILNDYVTRQLALAEFPYYDEVLSPSGGVTSDLPILLAEYQFGTKQDVEDYLTMLSQMDTYFSGILEYEQEKAKKGLFMSDSSCMKVLDGCEVFTEHPDDNFLVQTFANRLDTIEGLSDSEKADYISRNQAVISEHVVPAYCNMVSGLTKLLGLGRNNWGLCNFPEGAAYYEALVAYDTGCDDGVESLYQQIEAARQEDMSVCKQILANNPKLATTSPELDSSLTDENAMVKFLQTAILKDFPKPPKTNCEICHVDPTLSEYLAPAFYITAPIDDYLNNRIYINDANAYDDLYYFTTLAHEGYPGHLYQTVQSYRYGIEPVHTLLDYPAYTEGWATYVEMQSYYYAGLDHELAALLQHNQAATLSLYATSDIGIHFYGWEEADMKKFWSDFGISDDKTIRSITDLILESPGNYLKYYVGYLKFRQLRAACEKKAGKKFDPVKFHEQILQIGPAPFALLEEKML